jgi:hypothetical protein
MPNQCGCEKEATPPPPVTGDETALRLAATRVVQLATRNQVIATHAAIAELRRVLDGNPEVAG